MLRRLKRGFHRQCRIASPGRHLHDHRLSDCGRCDRRVVSVRMHAPRYWPSRGLSISPPTLARRPSDPEALGGDMLSLSFGRPVVLARGGLIAGSLGLSLGRAGLARLPERPLGVVG